MTLTALYRPYSSLGRLLYVGIATDAEERMDGHQRDHWFADIAAVDITLYPDRRSAKTAETEAIKAEWPLWNIAESPLGCIASDRKHQHEGWWRQDKWGCWHRNEHAVLPPRDFTLNPWTFEEEERLRREVRHQCHVQRMTREALRVALRDYLVAAVLNPPPTGRNPVPRLTSSPGCRQGEARQDARAAGGRGPFG